MATKVTKAKKAQSASGSGRGNDVFYVPAAYLVVKDGEVIATLDATNKRKRYMDTTEWELRAIDNAWVRYFRRFKDAKAFAETL